MVCWFRSAEWAEAIPGNIYYIHIYVLSRGFVTLATCSQTLQFDRRTVRNGERLAFLHCAQSVWARCWWIRGAWVMWSVWSSRVSALGSFTLFVTFRCALWFWINGPNGRIASFGCNIIMIIISAIFILYHTGGYDLRFYWMWISRSEQFSLYNLLQVIFTFCLKKNQPILF